MARRTARALAVALVAALALVALALAVLQTDWGRERVRRFALERLRSTLRGEVDVARLGGDLLRGVTFHDVAIHGPRGDPFLEVERLEVGYDVTGFLRQEVLLGEVVLVQPRIVLLQDSAGTWNLQRILPEPDTSSPASAWGSVVRVDDLRIRDGSVLVVSRAEPRAFGPLGSRVELQSVNGRLSLELDRAADDLRAIAADGLSFRVPEAGLVVRELDASVESTRDALRIERLLLRTPASELTASGRVRDLGADPVLDLTLRAGPLAFTDVRPFSERVPPEGTLSGSLRVEGPSDSLSARLEDVALRTPRSRVSADGRLVVASTPSFEGRVQLAPLHPADARAAYADYPLEDPLTARLETRLSRGRTELEGELAFGATRATFSGTLGLGGADPAYDLRGEVAGLDLRDFFEEPRWASLVNGAARVRGRGRVADIEASVRDSWIRGYRVRSGTFTGALRGETLLVEDLRLQLPSTRGWVVGRAQLGGAVDLTFEVASRDLGDLLPDSRVLPAAVFTASGRVRGAPGSLAADVRARVDSLVAGATVVDSLGLVASLRGIGGPRLSGSVEAIARDVRGPGGSELERAALEATFAGGAGEAVLTVRADSLRHAAAHALVSTAPSGPRVVVDSLTLAAGERVWRLREGGAVVYAGGGVRFDDAVLERESRRISLAGRADLDGPLDMRLGFEAVPMGELQEIAGLEPTVTGTLGGSARVEGTAAAPVLDAVLRVVDVRAAGLALATAEGRLAYADRRLTLGVEVVPAVPEGEPAGEAGRLSLHGTVPVDLALRGADPRFPDGPLDLVLESTDLRLTALQTGAAATQPGDSLAALGSLDARVRVTGRPSDPRIEGTFELGASRLRGVAIERLAGTVAYADRELGLEAELVPGGRTADPAADDARAPGAPAAVPGVLLVRGRVPVDLSLGVTGQRLLERPLDVAVEGRGLTLRLLEAAVPGVTEASGPLELDVRLTGTPETPRWEGHMAVRDGSFRAGGGVRYAALNGALRFDNDEVVIQELRVSSPGGRASARGRVALTDLVPGAVEVELSARGFTLIDEEGKELIVDAALDVGGTAQAPVVTGTVTVEQMVWPLPETSDKDVIRLDEAIFYVRAEGDTATTAPAPDVWEQTRMEVDVTIEDDVVLRSDDALIVLAGDLSLRKARGAARPSVAGTLDVVRGTYRDFGRTFEVTEGGVRFFGTPDLNPGLDVTAKVTVENEDDGAEVQVTLELAGTVQEPQLDLSSAPAFDRSEILSLLLFGTPTPGAGQEARFRSTVTRVAASQAAAPLTGALADELGLDLLEIQPGVGAQGGGFRAGKYVASDVFVTYTRDAGPEADEGLGVEYRISDQWSLQTQAGSRQFGVDVFYEFSY